MERRVVITGIGAITPIGNDLDKYWESLKNGVNGVDFITKFDITDHKVKIGAEVKDFDPTLYVDKKEVKRNDLFTLYALAAATQALEDSNIKDNVDPYRFGTIVSSGIGGLGTIETNVQRLLEKGPKRVNPMYIPMAIANMASGNVAILAGAKGYCSSVVTACAAGSHSIGDAFKLIQANRLDAAIAGGAEATITPSAIAGFANLTALNMTEDINRASIPFDKERGGFVMGEGAGVIILEELEHAKKRGATIYGEIVGYGATCDAYHITAPNGEGGARAMVEAVADAGIDPTEVGYINAHGTSTPLNDKFETQAIKDAFGDHAYNLNVSSTKSMTGHLLGASGAIEAIATIMALKNSIIPPTINYKVKDEECNLNITPNQAVEKNIKYAISNSLGFGGHNASLLFKKWEG